MPAPPPPPSHRTGLRIGRRAPERLAGWLVTGPLGHLWSVIADLGVYSSRELVGRVRRGVVERRR